MHYSLPLVFDSYRLTAKKPMEFIREEFGRRVLQVDMDGIGETPFRVRLSADRFGIARIAQTTSSPLCNTRGRQLVANSDGCIGYVIPLRGRYIAGHNGAFHTLVPGQVMALTNDMEGIVSCPAGGSFLTIIAPHTALVDMLGCNALRFGERLDIGSGSLALVHAYLRFMAAGSMAATEASRAVIGRQLIELLALGTGADSGMTGEAGEMRLLPARSAAIRAEIDRHFHEAWFGIESCAAKLGLSVRYVQVLCQREGTSFVAEVRRRRLELAMRILIDPASRNMRIIDVALECGYRDVSHFNRQFRAAFGDSPSGVRNSQVGG